MSFFRKMWDRAREPSTWAGLGVVVEAAAPIVGVPQGVGTGVAAISGGLAMILREGRK